MGNLIRHCNIFGNILDSKAQDIKWTSGDRLTIICNGRDRSFEGDIFQFIAENETHMNIKGLTGGTYFIGKKHMFLKSGYKFTRANNFKY